MKLKQFQILLILCIKNQLWDLVETSIMLHCSLLCSIALFCIGLHYIAFLWVVLQSMLLCSTRMSFVALLLMLGLLAAGWLLYFGYFFSFCSSVANFFTGLSTTWLPSPPALLDCLFFKHPSPVPPFDCYFCCCNHCSLHCSCVVLHNIALYSKTLCCICCSPSCCTASHCIVWHSAASCTACIAFQLHHAPLESHHVAPALHHIVLHCTSLWSTVLWSDNSLCCSCCCVLKFLFLLQLVVLFLAYKEKGLSDFATLCFGDDIILYGDCLKIQCIQEKVLFCTLLLLLCGKQKSTIINRVTVVLNLS